MVQRYAYRPCCSAQAQPATPKGPLPAALACVSPLLPCCSTHHSFMVCSRGGGRQRGRAQQRWGASGHAALPHAHPAPAVLHGVARLSPRWTGEAQALAIWKSNSAACLQDLLRLVYRYLRPLDLLLQAAVCGTLVGRTAGAEEGGTPRPRGSERRHGRSEQPGGGGRCCESPGWALPRLPVTMTAICRIWSFSTSRPVISAWEWEDQTSRAWQRAQGPRVQACLASCRAHQRMNRSVEQGSLLGQQHVD